jgi:hypothetical protein
VLHVRDASRAPKLPQAQETRSTGPREDSDEGARWSMSNITLKSFKSADKARGVVENFAFKMLTEKNVLSATTWAAKSSRKKEKRWNLQMQEWGIAVVLPLPQRLQQMAAAFQTNSMCLRKIIGSAFFFVNLKEQH